MYSELREIKEDSEFVKIKDVPSNINQIIAKEKVKKFDQRSRLNISLISLIFGLIPLSYFLYYRKYYNIVLIDDIFYWVHKVFLLLEYFLVTFLFHSWQSFIVFFLFFYLMEYVVYVFIEKSLLIRSISEFFEDIYGILPDIDEFRSRYPVLYYMGIPLLLTYCGLRGLYVILKFKISDFSICTPIFLATGSSKEETERKTKEEIEKEIEQMNLKPVLRPQLLPRKLPKDSSYKPADRLGSLDSTSNKTEDIHLNHSLKLRNYVHNQILRKLVKNYRDDPSYTDFTKISRRNMEYFDSIYILERIKNIAENVSNEKNETLIPDNQIILHVFSVWISKIMNRDTKSTDFVFQKYLYYGDNPILTKDVDIILGTTDYYNFYIYTKYQSPVAKKFHIPKTSNSVFLALAKFFWFVGKKHDFFLNNTDLKAHPFYFNKLIFSD